MASTYLSFLNCATYLDDETAAEIDRSQGSSVQHLLSNIRSYHVEYDPFSDMMFPNMVWLSLDLPFALLQPFARFPQCFFYQFRDLIHDNVILRDPNYNEIEVHVVKKCNEMCFGRGWSKLREVYQIWFGAWLDFTYVNPGLLSISLRSLWGGEIQYPTHDPPLKCMLPKVGSDFKLRSSKLPRSFSGPVLPTYFDRSYVKTLTAYDVQSGILVLPWYGFGESAFAFTFSELVLVDYVGTRYRCRVKFTVDSDGELACKLWGGWAELCKKHQVLEGHKVRFAVTEPTHNNVMHVCVYPQIGIETILSYPLNDGTYLPLYVSQQHFVAYG